jgi:hypothetical protein
VKNYYSGYLVDDYALFPPTPYKARGWTISFEDPPSDAQARGTATIDGESYQTKAVIVRAAYRERAQYAADSIHASLCLMWGELPPFDGTVVVRPQSDSAEEDTTPSRRLGAPRDVHVGRLPLACLMAVKASYRKVYQYALFKHLLSHQVFSTSLMGLDPTGWWSSQFVFDSPEHHVRCAYAIVLAYSVLEELSLEVRASSKNPSRKRGQWNPPVKQELETRLKNAGIDLSETFLWILRDTPTRIERRRPLDIESRAPWAGLKVRDSEIALIDAIAYVSWLRSQVSAHSLRDLAASLSYYDVLNAQHLARRLLLEKLGFWRYEERERVGTRIMQSQISEDGVASKQDRMTYRVYENWTVRPEKAMVHRSDCPYANGGPIRPPTKNGKWHGPFATYKEALEAAEATGREEVRGCKYCSPSAA